MPLPKRKDGENKSKFISRCMGDSIMNTEYPDQSQRYAVCLSQSKGNDISDSFEEINYGSISLVENPYIPNESDYIDSGGTIINISKSEYVYRDPKSGELFFFTRKVNKKGLVFVRQTSAYEYGSCPICGHRSILRERRLNGDDTCINSHRIKSSSVISRDAVGSIYIDRPFMTDSGYAVYIYNGDLFRIDFKKNKVEGSFDKDDPRYWSNKVGT